MRELKRFLLALGYFTRLPIPAWVGYAPDELNRAARYFPLVGLVVGVLAAAVLWSSARLLPMSLAIILSMIFSLLLTGGFHEDGLADAADGFGGGWEKSDVLRIMKDSRVGSFGAMALVLVLLSKFLALQALAQQGYMLSAWALIAVNPLSRLTALCLMGRLAYVRDDDSARAKPVAEGIGFAEIAIGTICGLAPAFLVAYMGIFSFAKLGAMLIALIIATLICARYFVKRIGGYTGDCLGAVQQLTELGAYCVLCAGIQA